MTKKKTKIPCIYLMQDGRYHLEITLQKDGKRMWRRLTLQPSLTLDQAQAKLVTFRARERKRLLEGVKDLDRIITVADYAEHWLPTKAPDLGPSTTDRYLRDLAHHILPFLGEYKIQRLTRSDVKAWVAHAQAKRKLDRELYAWETLEGWWRILRQLLQDAHADLSLEANPTYRVRGPKRRPGKRREQRTLTRSELAALLEATWQCAPQRYAEVLTLACTGMRPGEMYALQAKHIDSRRKRIIIEDSHWRGNHRDQTKGVDPREVYAPPELLDAIAKHRRDLIACQHPGLAGGLVFPSRTGNYRNGGSLAKPLAAACDLAGLTIHVTPQVLRRTFDTLMIEAGVDRVVLWSMIGHCDERQTRRYAGVHIEAKREAVERVIPLPKNRNVALECSATEQIAEWQETKKARQGRA